MRVFSPPRALTGTPKSRQRCVGCRAGTLGARQGCPSARCVKLGVPGTDLTLRAAAALGLLLLFRSAFRCPAQASCRTLLEEKKSSIKAVKTP